MQASAATVHAIRKDDGWYKADVSFSKDIRNESSENPTIRCYVNVITPCLSGDCKYLLPIPVANWQKFIRFPGKGKCAICVCRHVKRKKPEDGGGPFCTCGKPSCQPMDTAPAPIEAAAAAAGTAAAAPGTGAVAASSSASSARLVVPLSSASPCTGAAAPPSRKRNLADSSVTATVAAPAPATALGTAVVPYKAARVRESSKVASTANELYSMLDLGRENLRENLDKLAMLLEKPQTDLTRPNANSSNAFSPLDQAVANGLIEALPLLLKHWPRDRPFARAGKMGKTPLLLLTAMCEQVADPQLQPKEPRATCTGTVTGSSSRGRGRASADSSGRRAPPVNTDELCKMAEMLIEVDPECIETPEKNGWTPLMTACEWGCLPLVQLLLERGASVEPKDNHKMTALHWCAEQDRPAHADVISILLEYKADPHATNDQGKTPLELANEYKSAPAILAALQSQPYETLPRTKEGVKAAAAAAAAPAPASGRGRPHGASGRGPSTLKLLMPPDAHVLTRGPSAAEIRAAEDRRRQQQEQQREAEMDAAICQICNGGLCEDGNEILFCDGEKWGGPCGVAVHQQCYHLGELPSGDWLCDACAPQQHDPSAADGTMVRCELCEGTSYREGGRWQSFPLMRCRPPSCEKAGFIHAACAASFPQIFREESLGGAWVWDEEGQAIIDKLRKLKQPCYLCEERGGCLVQCRHGSSLTGCKRALHPLCAQMQRLVRPIARKGDEVGAFCCLAHLPAAIFDDEDDVALAAKGRTERHEELFKVVGPMADQLAPLLTSMHDNQKRRLTLRDLFTLPPSSAVSGEADPSLRAFFGAGAGAPPPTLVHLLAVAGGAREQRRLAFKGRQATTTDGLTMLLCHAARAHADADTAEATRAAAPQSAPSRAVSSASGVAMMEGMVECAGGALTPPNLCDECDGDEDEAAEISKEQPYPCTSNDAASQLRLCCTGWGLGGELGDAAGLGRLLNCCEHSPFAAAVRAGYVERALLLYNASHASPQGAGALSAGPKLTPAAPMGDGEEDDRGSVPAMLCAVAHALFEREMSVSMRHLLLLLAARAALPTAGSKAQLDAAQKACGARGWWPAGSTDVANGAERRTTIEWSGQVSLSNLPPFVYVCENVMVDVTPQWAAGAANGGCKCCEPQSECGAGTKPVCTETTCRACRGKQQECGYACTCITSPVKCRNRKLQAGLVCPLSLYYFGPQKGWGVKACQFIKQGDFVIEYVGEVISEHEMERRERACDEQRRYVFTPKSRSKEQCYIDAHAVRNLAAFINFGCAPNLELKSVRSLSGDKRLDRVAFYAKRDIEAGTELTYRRDADAVSKARRSRIVCNCDAGAVCMGFL